MWNRFVDNSISSSKPGANIKIDKQLFPMKARCQFTQYTPNKPEKLGIKFCLAVEVKTKYTLNAILFLGKGVSLASAQRLSDWVVVSLMKPFLGKDSNSTTDNFLTLLKLAKRIWSKSKQISLELLTY